MGSGVSASVAGQYMFCELFFYHTQKRRNTAVNEDSSAF